MIGHVSKNLLRCPLPKSPLIASQALPVFRFKTSEALPVPPWDTSSCQTFSFSPLHDGLTTKLPGESLHPPNWPTSVGFHNSNFSHKAKRNTFHFLVQLSSQEPSAYKQKWAQAELLETFQALGRPHSTHKRSGSRAVWPTVPVKQPLLFQVPFIFFCASTFPSPASQMLRGLEIPPLHMLSSEAHQEHTISISFCC